MTGSNESTKIVQVPYMADISFLQPVIHAYKSGAFNDRGLSTRVINALDSLSWYGDVKKTETRLVTEKKPKTYRKKSEYWKDPKAYKARNK